MGKVIFLIVVILLLISVVIAVLVYLLSANKEPKPFRDSIQNNIASVSSYSDLGYVHKVLNVLYYKYDKRNIKPDELEKALIAVKSELEGTGKYYTRFDNINISDSGKTIGAYSDKEQIGGSENYSDILIGGDYTAKKTSELLKAASYAKEGDVIYILPGSTIDLTGHMLLDDYSFILKEGVTLAGDRVTTVIKTDANVNKTVILADKNVRITGIILKGPDGTTRNRTDDNLTTGIYTESDGLFVDNCEISGFSKEAISISGGIGHKVQYSFIHHNRTNLSKSINIYNNASADVSYNLFNYNTYSVYANNANDVSVSNNIELGTIYKSSMFVSDKHGIVNIFNNTFLTDNSATNETLINAPNDISVSDNHIDKSEADSTLDNYAKKFKPKMLVTNISGRNFYGEAHKVVKELLRIDLNKRKSVLGNIENALIEIELYTNYYAFKDDGFSFKKGGKVYGARPDKNPIGGGFGYKDVYTDGDYIVKTYEELIDALAKAKSGEVVFIKGEPVIDVTFHGEPIVIPDGVTLAGERGNGSSYGAIIQCDSFAFNPLFKPGNNVRITGLNFKGADPERRNDWYSTCLTGVNQLGRTAFYTFIVTDGIIVNGDNLEVDNCEFSGFSHAAIYVTGGTGHNFHHNFIHHNQRLGLGYGICMNQSTADISYNLMNYSRHDIAGTGAPGTSYTASNNIQMGESTSHNFDMHGGWDRKDGTDIAGDRIIMRNNTFLSETSPYLLRGTPTEVQEFSRNAVYMEFSHFKPQALYGQTDERKERVKFFDNLFNIKGKSNIVK